MTPLERRLFLALFVVAAALAAPLPGSNQMRTLALAKAMAAGRLWIDPDAGTTADRARLPGRTPLAFAALGVTAPGHGHIYSGGAPGLAVLILPAHELGRRFLPARALDLALLLLGGALPFALGALAVKRAVATATGSSEEVAVAAAAAHGLGTIALPYATRLFAHVPVVALVAAALALLLRPGGKRGALAGLAAGVAVACDYGAALALAPLAAVAASVGGRRALAGFALGGLPVAVALGAYHQACFGAPWRTAYDLRDDPGTRALLAEGLYGFTTPSPWVLLQLLVGVRRGYLFTQPVALLGLVGLAVAAREAGPARRVLAIALGGATLVLLAHASRVQDWHGGWAHGPRYSIAALPFLALGLPRGISLAAGIAGPLLATSGFLAWVGATVDWSLIGSARTSVQAFLLLGPRARGVASLLLGVGPQSASASTSLVAAVVLGAAFATAARLLAGRRAAVALAVLPFAAALPFLGRNFVEGSRGIRAAYAALYRSELASGIAGAHDAADARACVGAARFLGAPDLVLAAQRRVLELDPEDAAARETIERDDRERRPASPIR